MRLDRPQTPGRLPGMVRADPDSSARRLIAAAGGRQTRPRIAALVALLQAGRALPHADLHRLLPDLDRVSLYRALDWLAEHHLAHRLTDADGVRRYGPSSPASDHRHPHFQCTHCGFTTCLEMPGKPALRVPRGFQIVSIDVLARGLCQGCAEGASG